MGIQSMFAAILCVCLVHAQCDITDYGNDVARAMQACCSKGGGLVRVPRGRYEQKPFAFPCDDLALVLEEGAMIVASSNKDDYKGQSQPRFIYAEKRSNISIYGTGVIDGSGSAWWSDSSTSSHPYLIYFYHCNKVRFQDVTLQNSAKLTLVPKPCDDVKIFNVTINNPYTKHSRNLDCIDPAGTNIHIKGCTLNCGDDNVAIKGPASDILVEDSFFGTGHGASIGSITDTAVKNVTFRNIVMNGTDNGCRIKTTAGYSGGSVSYITFTNITMNYVKHPLVIDGAYSGSYDDNTQKTKSATISHISFSDIKGTNTRDKCELECGSDCTNVVLSNIDLTPDHQAECSNVKGTVLGPVSPSSLDHCVSSAIFKTAND